LTGAGSTIEENETLRVIVSTEELGESENVETRNNDRSVGDLAKGLVESMSGVTLRNAWPDVRVWEFQGSLRLESGAVSRIPTLCKVPEVLEDPKASLISQDGLGVVLDGPERFGRMTDTHANVAVILVFGPSQLFDVSAILESDVERVVTDDLDIRKSGKNFLAVMMDNGDLTMLHSLQAVDSTTVLNTQTLLS